MNNSNDNMKLPPTGGGISSVSLLTQAVLTENDFQLEEILRQTNRKLIGSALERLPLELTVPFLNMQNLSSTENPLCKLKSLLVNRTNTYQELLKLHGVLELNTTRISSLSQPNMLDQTPKLVIFEKDQEDIDDYETLLLAENQPNSINTEEEKVIDPTKAKKRANHKLKNGHKSKKY